MGTPMKRPSKRTARRPKDDAGKDRLEGLQSLPVAPPSELVGRQVVVWQAELAPLIESGLIKQADYTACVQYAKLAALDVLKMTATQMQHYRALSDRLGCNPQARLRLAPAADEPKRQTLAELIAMPGPGERESG